MYQSFIGLEVHIHLLTDTKVFCKCKRAFGEEPNTNVCPVCLGYPGVLPSLNEEAMRMSAMVAKALNCTIPPKTWFERKQYFYPDMTKNYQISQFAEPIGQNGHVDIEYQGKTKRIRIKECHLEEDAGKMIHAGNVSLIDYNRAGTSLLEIVTEPDLEVGEEAEIYIQQLRRMVRYLGVCDGNMEEGSLRCDANVSINTPGAGLGKKVEIKNLNSSRFVKLGLNYEIKRQAEVLDKGGTIRQETRLWNENRDQTEVMREKESSNDYRFFPEPDLPPFLPDSDFLASVDYAMCELPLSREKRISSELGLTREQAFSLCEEKALADYFEEAVTSAFKLGMDRKDAAGKISQWITTELRRVLNKDGKSVADVASLKLTPPRFASLVHLATSSRISGKSAKQVLELVLTEDKEPEAIVTERGWFLITDPAIIGEAVGKVFAADPKTVASATAAVEGEDKLLLFLVGKVIGATQGRAEPVITKRLVEEKLKALK